MEVNERRMNTSSDNKMKTIKVHNQNLTCDINPSEEIVIQMDDDGYRVTTYFEPQQS